MTRKLLICLALLSLLFIAAGEKTSPAVQRVLTNAINNERAAIARYDAFAVKAEGEGYIGVADLFRAEAKAERVHLARFTAVMNDRGLPLPPDDTKPPSVGSTSANLQTSVSAEFAERDHIYLDAYRAADDAKDSEVATIFDQTRDAETEHGNLCSAAARNLDAMKEPHAYNVCPVCGYTTDLKLPVCPSCRHAMH